MWFWALWRCLHVPHRLKKNSFELKWLFDRHVRVSWMRGHLSVRCDLYNFFFSYFIISDNEIRVTALLSWFWVRVVQALHRFPNDTNEVNLFLRLRHAILSVRSGNVSWLISCVSGFHYTFTASFECYSFIWRHIVRQIRWLMGFLHDVI